jgi:Asp-tRNA(Asn)/Glu-tRNA(Gln) amidotransferase A subunit family amidase
MGENRRYNFGMETVLSLREKYREGRVTPVAELDAALARANSNAGRNVYLAQDAEWSRGEAKALKREEMDSKPLWGVPVSLKDCFELAGFTTSSGSKFYRETNGVAKEDSWVAAKLRAAGAVVTGKTHLHQLAYGITGQSREFGDCVQPSDAARLTGGSSSGAAASVQEGSAIAAIGTDTGGSVRVPAMLCGLCGYRSSLSLNTAEVWRGGAHLAASFDTVGWLYRDLADGPTLGAALFDLPAESAPVIASLKIGVPDEAFLHDCDADVSAELLSWQSLLSSSGATLERFDAKFWEEARGIFAPIQANEAAALHRGNFAHFETEIAERLAWGESIEAEEVARLREKLEGFREQMHALLAQYDFLLLPCAPTSALLAADDHSETRGRLLRYTAPISLAGLPVVTLPGGMQLVAPMGADATLLAVSAALGAL